jgi:hypothetical protein
MGASAPCSFAVLAHYGLLYPTALGEMQKPTANTPAGVQMFAGTLPIPVCERCIRSQQ